MGLPAALMLIFSALIVVGVCTYKFTTKKIAPLVGLQCMSEYLGLCILHVLLGYVECRKFEARTKILRAFYIFHVVYWVLIALSFKSATCTEDNFYPSAFLVNNCFFIGIYVMVFLLHSKDYTLEWSPDEAKAETLFKAQTDRFMKSYTFLVEWHMIEVGLGMGLDVFSDAVMCGDGGTKWLFASGKGNLFMMMHIIGTMLGTGMARAVFIKTAKATLFGGDEDSSDDEG